MHTQRGSILTKEDIMTTSTISQTATRVIRAEYREAGLLVELVLHTYAAEDLYSMPTYLATYTLSGPRGVHLSSGTIAADGRTDKATLVAAARRILRGAL